MDQMPEDYIQAARKCALPTLLMFVVAAKQPDLVDLLLKKGAPVNARGDYLIPVRDDDAVYLDWLMNATALHIAADQQDLPMVERLLKAGASVDARDGDGRTALQIAVTQSSLPIVSRLIKAHCNVNIADREGNIALKEAAKNERWDIYDLLKRAGAQGNYDFRNVPPGWFDGPTP